MQFATDVGSHMHCSPEILHCRVTESKVRSEYQQAQGKIGKIRRNILDDAMCTRRSLSLEVLNSRVIIKFVSVSVSESESESESDTDFPLL